jgi:hypothetical protein
MKTKALFFLILILSVGCLILFLPVIAVPLNHINPDWLAYEPAIAQYGYGGSSEERDSDSSDTPPPPPDQVNPGQSGVFMDPTNPGILVWFAPGSVNVPVQIRTFYSGLPSNIPGPPGSIGPFFFFGAWINGKGMTINEFDPPIVISVPYDSGISRMPGAPDPFQSVAGLAHPGLFQLSGSPLALITYPALTLLADEKMALLPPTQEQQLRLNMYNPTTQSWVKLCSSVNVHTKRISGVLASPIPIDSGGNTLLAVAVDDTPPLNQVVDNQGKTTISIEGVNTRLQVLPGTVEPGTHFEVTLLPALPANNNPAKLLDSPLDVKACKIDHMVNENSTELTHLPKPLGIEFDYDAETLAIAGGRNNVTTVLFQNGQWVDMEEFGYQVLREQDKIIVDTDSLGTVGLAAR